MSDAARTKTRLTFYSDAEYFGGAEEYLALLARTLQRDAFDLSVVLPDSPGAKVLEGRMRSQGVAVHHLPRPGFRWLAALAGTKECFRTVGGEVLHMNLPSCYDAGISSVAWAARQAGYRRVVSTEHLPMIDRKYKKFLVKAFFSHWVDQVIVNTRSNRGFLIRRHGIDPGKIRVVDNGVEDAIPLSGEERNVLRREWGVPEGAAIIGIVGRLTRRKGHHFLLQALAGLLEEGPPRWILVVAGDGEEEEALRLLSDRLGLGSRVVWLGHREDARRLMMAFDLLTLPSTVETMPFAILEGMAASLSVVASAIYGIPELIVHEETGYLVPPGDVIELRARLRDLILDPGRRRAMGERGRRRYEERFAAACMAEATARCYRGDEGQPGVHRSEDLDKIAADPVGAAVT